MFIAVFFSMEQKEAEEIGTDSDVSINDEELVDYKVCNKDSRICLMLTLIDFSRIGVLSFIEV